MIVSRRRTALPELHASLATHALVHSAFRLHVVRNQGVVSEDRLSLRAFERKGHLGRPVLTVVLAGRARLECGGAARWLEPGDVSLAPYKDAIVMRQDGPRFESLALEWEPGTLGARPATWETARLPVGFYEQLRRLVDAVTDASADTALAAARFAAIVSLLRASGAPLGDVPPCALVEDVPEHMGTLSSALDGTLSNLAESPMMVDLDQALGVTPRHLQRLVTAFHERYGFNAGGWRDALNRRRLLIGASMMTARGATTERVALAMGYGSATAFCRALSQAHLPSPSAVSRVVGELL
ncbi:MAG TPA: AraC family transcriptional regulator [Polyangiaceae bacterium]|jgi:AraC-like DNA-binding protein